MRNLLHLAMFLLALSGLAEPLRGVWQVASPQHAQTFAYGSESGRGWIQSGNHLELVIHFTNDPFVDQTQPRQYDDFSFDFPQVVLGPDHRTFYYHPPGQGAVPVAVKGSGFLIPVVSLVPSAHLVVESPHGFLTMVLVVDDHAMADSR